MHMPGHKRNTVLLGGRLPYAIDITEISGFDNLYRAQGILRETAQAAAALYGSRQAFLLVNGSTAGILAAVRATVKPGGTLILARNCHKSVYHAAELCGLHTAYLLPETDEEAGIEGSIAPGQVAASLAEHPDAGLVVITSPTYTGVISDISSISAVCHQRGVPLMVDQAHGAHLGFSPAFPGEALKGGADIVVTGLHKTLPALTQCALVHVGGSLIDADAVARELSVFQTSSPSYVLMASIDHCIRLLAERKGDLFRAYEANLASFDLAVRDLKKLRVLCHGSDVLARHRRLFLFDPGKIVILTENTALTGTEFARLLRTRHQIELEMAGTRYAVAMTSICDTAETFARLADALLDVDRRAELVSGGRKPESAFTLPAQRMPICEALRLDGCLLPLAESAGATALEYVWAYPPGVPLIVPGERIDPDFIRYLKYLGDAEIALDSTRGKLPPHIYAKPQQFD